MKSFVIAVIAALSFGTAASAQGVTGPHTFCAEKARWGWKITGDANAPGSAFHDWHANKAIGEIIGDGNCQEGWTMISTVDARVMDELGMSGVTGRSNFTVNSVTGVTTTTTDAGRITASWQGFAPEQLKGRSVAKGGDATKWKLVDTDGANHTYKLKKRGIHPWPKGSIWVASDQDIIDRDFKGGTAVVDPLRYDKLRYAASRDHVTTDRQHDRYVTVRSVRYSCPSVWSYAHVAPTGEMVVYTKDAKPCKAHKSTRTVLVGTSTSSTTRSGSKYVTPQN